MKVLICGASGFIGEALVDRFLKAGHEVVAGLRNVPAVERPGVSYIEVDFNRDFDSRSWETRLEGIDAVVNAVGIFRESAAARFESLHVRAPIALFTAARNAGVRRVIQVSALGADESARTAYHLSKRAADQALGGLGVSHAIVRPSLVYAPGGDSARLFGALASLPLIPLPGRGGQRIQPILLADLCDAVLVLAENQFQGCMAVVGPEPLSLRKWLAMLREALGLGRARFLCVPMPLVRLAAGMAGALGSRIFSSDALAMLERGNTADAAPLASLLGRPPTPASRFIAPMQREFVRDAAFKGWLLPLLRLSLAVVWLSSGVVSLGLYPVEQSYALLAAAGITGSLAWPALYGAALLDVLFGLLMLFPRVHRHVYLAQIAVILGYTLIIAWKLPEFWLHPFGPLTKNLPMLAALVLLHQWQPRKNDR
jgi:uncharacterized protein YbjT (DUF2867 family)/uncharacterized membrane protein YphA (DoxX/SURF4 family)